MINAKTFYGFLKALDKLMGDCRLLPRVVVINRDLAQDKLMLKYCHTHGEEGYFLGIQIIIYDKV
jgi:hypothetical protein